MGLVRDASGAVVAGAKVTVTDVDRGTQLTLSTNDEGEYVASPLRIGHYTVTVEKQGFKRAVAGPVRGEHSGSRRRGPEASTWRGNGNGHGYRRTARNSKPKPRILARWWTASASTRFP